MMDKSDDRRWSLSEFQGDGPAWENAYPSRSRWSFFAEYPLHTQNPAKTSHCGSRSEHHLSHLGADSNNWYLLSVNQQPQPSPTAFEYRWLSRETGGGTERSKACQLYLADNWRWWCVARTNFSSCEFHCPATCDEQHSTGRMMYDCAIIARQVASIVREVSK